MNLENILPDLVKCFYLSEPIDGELEYSEMPLKVNAEDISGQLLEYYQHLSFEGDCYFGDQLFGMILFPALSESTEPEAWALQANERFQNRDYIIFAATISDDIIFCDIRDEKNPVYGLISGDDKAIKLSDSLFDFLVFYTKLTKLQVIEFKKEIYANKNLDYKKDFIERVYSLISNDFSKNVDGLVEFILSGTLHLIDINKESH
ncbi:hypothetical protein [Aggregatibacter kilianii]|uniref:hypothetical protein n=1 Tax=Aggregatibacter kilianii TaxID=2025884 RepID=UPI000D65018A|nr:hypothetical protein [Aggregatibacter kilianii]